MIISIAFACAGVFLLALLMCGLLLKENEKPPIWLLIILILSLTGCLATIAFVFTDLHIYHPNDNLNYE